MHQVLSLSVLSSHGGGSDFLNTKQNIATNLSNETSHFPFISYLWTVLQLNIQTLLSFYHISGSINP